MTNLNTSEVDLGELRQINIHIEAVANGYVVRFNAFTCVIQVENNSVEEFERALAVIRAAYQKAYGKSSALVGH